MKYQKRFISFIAVAIVSLALFSANAFVGDQSERSGPVVQIKDARLKIETNATDSDAGIQVFIDADQWKVMRIFDPNGTLVFESKATGRFGKQGGTELFLESAEPDFTELPFDEFLKRFPEGIYKFRGVGLEGQRYVGEAKLTHNVPAGPELVSPIEGDGLQDPKKTVLVWRGVDDPNGSPIIGYEVLVVQPSTNFPAIPKVFLDILMPATATRLRVPDGYLLPDTEYEWEVLAIEAGGNQTLSSSTFKTLP
jgi:hypothetical protein